MREAASLGDRLLIEKVLMRINNFAQPPTADPKSNIIAFPIEHLALSPELKKQQKPWMTVLLTAKIPVGIYLFLLVLHFVTLGAPFPCQR